MSNFESGRTIPHLVKSQIPTARILISISAFYFNLVLLKLEITVLVQCG